MREELLPKLASLVTSAIVISKDNTLMILTAEVYSRHASIDIHCGSEYPSSTLLEKRNSRYHHQRRWQEAEIQACSRLEDNECLVHLLHHAKRKPQIFIGPETGISFT